MGSIPTPNFAFPVQWLRLGTQQLHIIVRPGVQAPRFHHVALNVDDFAAVYWTARERKLHDESAFFSKMYELPDGAVQMYVRDPAGNLVEVDWPDARTLDARIQEDLIPLSATAPQTGDALIATSIWTGATAESARWPPAITTGRARRHMNENRKDIMPIADTNPPRILVLGSTGRTGGAVATQIEADHHDVVVVRAARDQATVDQWRDQGLAAARLDLDDARTFPAALDGIDRLFVMTGYTIAMTHQTKMITDAAADAGVGHLVHLGIFGDGRSTEPHFAWHELVECYIEGSGIAWTHLHPHMFMENLLTTFPLRDWRFTWPAGDKPCGLIAGEDLAAVAAKVLAEGPDAHAGQGYWLSTDVLDGKGIAGALTSALGRPIAADIITPDDLRAAIGAGVLRPPAFMETTYALSTLEWLHQLYDGRMDRTIYTTTTVEDLLGRPPTHLEDWAALHRAALLTSNTTSAPA